MRIPVLVTFIFPAQRIVPGLSVGLRIEDGYKGLQCGNSDFLTSAIHLVAVFSLNVFFLMIKSKIWAALPLSHFTDISQEADWDDSKDSEQLQTLSGHSPHLPLAPGTLLSSPEHPSHVGPGPQEHITHFPFITVPALNPQHQAAGPLSSCCLEASPAPKSR